MFFFFKQKTAYEMRISDWSSDVCSSDLLVEAVGGAHLGLLLGAGVDRHDRGERVARRDVDQQETDNADAERDRQDVEQSLEGVTQHRGIRLDRKSTRLNSSH